MKTLTTAEAATLAGKTPGQFRALATHERRRGNEMRAPRDKWPDSRTPKWDAGKVTAWVDARARKDTP